MKHSKELANRVREVLLNGKWIANTNYKHSLSDLSWEQATTKIGSLNTIAALTYHINYYTAGVLNVFEGGKLEIRDKYSFDLPSIESQEDWENLLNEKWSTVEKFANHVELMSDEQLEAGFVNEKYGTYRKNIEAVIEHSYYHLGQIVLIKKMIFSTQKQFNN
jgi:hypothetical protein